MNTLKQFFYDEDGLGTVEIVILLIVLVGMALLFKGKISTFVSELIKKITEKQGEINIDITE